MYVFYFCYERGDADVFYWPNFLSQDGEKLAANDCVWIIPGTYREW